MSINARVNQLSTQQLHHQGRHFRYIHKSTLKKKEAILRQQKNQEQIGSNLVFVPNLVQT